MKRILKSKLVTLIMMVVLSLSMSAVVLAAETIVNGKYGVEVTSSAAMFKVVDAKLTAVDGKMSAVITLSGTGYSKLYMGTQEGAVAAIENDMINYVADGSGMYTFSVPVSALDTAIDVAAFSAKNQIWYDRTLTFNSNTLVLIEEPKVEEPVVEQPVIKEPQVEAPKQDVKEEAVTEGNDIPKTGDSNMVVISTIVLFAAAAILVRDRKLSRQA